MAYLTRIAAIVVNPKTGVPFFCVSDMHDDVERPSHDYEIRDFNGANQGTGYFETNRSSDYYVSAKKTGYPRIHTPQGVRQEGVGNGTCLYVAGACAVEVLEKREYEDLPQIGWNLVTGVNYDDRKSGISSTQDRSVKASKWWRKAVKVGLAEEVEIQSVKEHTINDCTYGESAREGIEAGFGVSIEGHEKDELSLCADGTYYEGEEVFANVLEYERAYEQNLVLATFLEPFLWDVNDNAQYEPSGVRFPARPQIVQFNAEVARAVNVGVFRSYDQPSEALALFGGICIAGGMKARDLDAIRERFNDGFDINPSAMMGVDDPRKNPSQRTKADKFAGIVKSYAPARRKNPAPRRNAAPTSAIIKSAEQLAEERRRLGWQRFADLP